MIESPDENGDWAASWKLNNAREKNDPWKSFNEESQEKTEKHFFSNNASVMNRISILR